MGQRGGCGVGEWAGWVAIGLALLLAFLPAGWSVARWREVRTIRRELEALTLRHEWLDQRLIDHLAWHLVREARGRSDDGERVG
jgi:hypothetical protein